MGNHSSGDDARSCPQFIKTPPTVAPNNIIGRIKGTTSRLLRAEFPELKKRLPTLWTRSYFVSTHGHVSSETIKK